MHYLKRNELDFECESLGLAPKLLFSTQPMMYLVKILTS